jgi:protein xylosyltransferase
MKKMFYNCDDHMYKVGERSLPFGLQWVGGSDWVVLHKDFAHYLVTSDDALVRGMTNFYFYSIMAPESFFHTSLFNSRYIYKKREKVTVKFSSFRFCETFENDNFRYINWNKGKTTGACSCTRYCLQ